MKGVTLSTLTISDRSERLEPTDEELVRLVAAAEEGALARLYERYGMLCHRLARTMLRDHARAEEVVQDAFFSVWSRASTYNHNLGPARSWLMSIVRNRAIDEMRRRRNEMRTAYLDESWMLVGSPDASRDALRAVESGEVFGALRRVPAKQREAITLAYFGGYSLAEVARLTGVSVGTVKSRVRLGLARLREEPVLNPDREPVPTSPAQPHRLPAVLQMKAYAS